MEKRDLRRVPFLARRGKVDVTDAHWREGSEMPLPRRKRRLRHNSYEQHSILLPMESDGVSLALDVLIPKVAVQAKGTVQIPTVLHQTRYSRSVLLKKPWHYVVQAGKPLDLVNAPTKRAFLVAGYAVVSVDVRGTGASFGSWEACWSEKERLDAREVLDWIVKQEWSNGRVALYGISYDAGAALRTMSLGHPSVVACIALYPFWDVYSTISFPGGIPLRRFLKEWSDINNLVDKNDFRGLSKVLGAVVNSVTPADRIENSMYGSRANQGGLGDDKLKELRFKSLKDAIGFRANEPNYDASKDLLGLRFCDEESSNADTTILSVSALNYIEEFLEASKRAPLLSISGWLDATASDAICSFHASQRSNAHSKLVLGPWNHGGIQHVRLAEGERSTFTAFDIVGEMMDFLEIHLAERRAQHDEPPVHYYCFGSGSWKASPTWPPSGQRGLYFFLDEAGTLDRQKPRVEGKTSYRVDVSVRPPGSSRWSAMLKQGKLIRYDDFAGAAYLRFVSGELESDIEMTGCPVVDLFVTSSDRKADIFVYLLNLSPNVSKSLYVTEGCFRSLHRKEVDLTQERDARRLAGIVPQCAEAPIPMHSFRQKDGIDLLDETPTKLSFHLLPTSYVFRRGSRVALAVAGVDAENFGLEESLASGTTRMLEISFGGAMSSMLRLPIILQ